MVIDEAPDVPASAKPPQPAAPGVAAAQDDQADRKKSKKRQSVSHQGDVGDGKRVYGGNDGDLKDERKEKKKKHKSEGQAVSVVE